MNKPIISGHGISEVKEFPAVQHFAALVEDRLIYDDGYGDRNQSSTSTLNYLRYVYLGDEIEVKKWVIEQDRPKYGAPAVYTIILVKPVAIGREVHISLNPQ